MNKCMFIGTICKDPELQGSEKPHTTFQIATQRFGNGADFVPITAFGKQAEVICKYFQKGSKIGLETHFQTGSYEKDGKKIYTNTFIVDKIDFCDKKGSNNSDDDFIGADDSDLPFN